MKCSGQGDQNGGAGFECTGQAMQQMRQPKQWARVDDNEDEQRDIYIVLCDKLQRHPKQWARVDDNVDEQRDIYIVLCDELQRHPKQLFNCRSYDMKLK